MRGRVVLQVLLCVPHGLQCCNAVPCEPLQPALAVLVRKGGLGPLASYRQVDHGCF